VAALAVVAALSSTMSVAVGPADSAQTGSVPAGWVLRVAVPDAIGGKTVIGQLTVDRVSEWGYVTAYGCDNGLPDGRSDLNFDGRITPAASNRLIVQADDDGEICFRTTASADLIVDVNAVSFDVGINSFANQRFDTRDGPVNAPPELAAGGVLRVSVPEARGGKTVIGQLTVDRAKHWGFVTAFGCDRGVPVGGGERSDLNFDGRITPAASNRLIVQADNDGEICFQTTAPADLIVDINATADVGITSFPNRRTDTRPVGLAPPQIATRGVVRVNVPEARGGKTVIGQLTVDRTSEWGYVTAYGCDGGVPNEARSDLNFDGRITPAASNRLIVQADGDGDVCFLTSARADMIIDINAIAGVGITSFPNRRTDTRTGTTSAEPPGVGPIPQWPPYEPLPALEGIAALTGEPAAAEITARPIVAVKIDNFRLARPQFGLDLADAVIELNVEGVSRFIALFHTDLPPEVGPVRSARTADLDLLAAMNRPVFAYSGSNAGVDAWIRSAADSGVVVDFSAQRNGCYRRTPDRPGPHNLLLDADCSASESPAGPARALWTIDARWSPADSSSQPDTSFAVSMDGVAIEWTWDSTSSQYLRSQDGVEHLAASGQQISARTVVELATEYVPSPVDARSPNAITVGTGTAVVHRDGRALDAVWTRATEYDPFSFVDATTGAPVPLDGGVTFLELVRA
jgi:Protein of unknown function (DUF3048) N-terminal domain/Protein of unknown function (DUF3048) C-terminal domain